MLDVYFWSVILFFAALAALIYYDRENIEFQSYVLAMRRTKRGKKIIDRAAKWSPRFWKIASTIGVIAAFLVMGFGIYSIARTTVMIFSRSVTAPAVQLILPIPQSQPISGMGFIGVPFWFWILIVPFVLFPHEFSHGIVARAEKVKIKTVGLIQLLIWSGAFVEPDEKQIERSKMITKLRIFSAGSISNIFIALVFIFLTQYALWPAFVPEGVILSDIEEGSPADMAGLEEGDVITSIGDDKVVVDYDEFRASYAYLLSTQTPLTSDSLENISSSFEVFGHMTDLEPGQDIIVEADGEMYELTVGGRPENSTLPYLGVFTKTINNNNFMFSFMFPLIWWLTTLSMLVAVFNLLPIYPLDGGLIVHVIAEKYSKKNVEAIVKFVTIAMIAILIFNFVGPLIINNFF